MEPIICLTATITVLFFIVRTAEVKKFKEELTYKCSEICDNFICSIPNNRDTTLEEEEHYDKLKAIWMSIEDISFYRMLFSFKPLKEECWLSEEQLRFIYGLL